MKKASKSVRLAVCISGGGSTMIATADAIDDGRLDVIEDLIVIASCADCAGAARAEERGIPVFVIDPREFSSSQQFAAAMMAILTQEKISFVSLNGWLPLMPALVVAAFRGRIINQHPGPLDPGRRHDFGGKGMFGRRVLAARIAYSWITQSEFWTEATVHHVTERFDEGEIILSRTVPIPARPDYWVEDFGRKDFTTQRQSLITATEALQSQMKRVEHETVLKVLSMISEQPLPKKRRDTPLVAPDRYGTLSAVKKLSIQIFPDG